MPSLFTPRVIYTRPELVSDGVVHVLGLTAALASVPVLITLTAFLRGDAPAIAGTAIYGATLIAMLLCSALYNMIRAERWQGLLWRLDHSAIYFKIAGTYTAFVMLTGTGLLLAVILWLAALSGAGLKVLAPHRFRWLGFALYLGMGWAGLVLGWPLFQAMSTPVVALIAVGGMTYTLGTLFYLMGRLPFHNTLWHVFVLAASVVFFAAVTTHVVLTAA